MVGMKGQAYILPETLIDVLQLITFVALFIGTFLIFTTYNVVIKSSIEDREAFEMIDVILGDRCLIFERDGNFFKGIFDVNKLAKKISCVELGKFSFKVEDLRGNSFVFGECSKEMYSVPITIKEGENLVLGKMVICY